MGLAITGWWLMNDSDIQITAGRIGFLSLCILSLVVGILRQKYNLLQLSD